MMAPDQYRTIDTAHEGSVYKDKGSKFIGYAYPFTDETQLQEYLAHLKRDHHSARHWCYAYQLGTGNKRFRANDDGEPNNSAGQPILGQMVQVRRGDLAAVGADVGITHVIDEDDDDVGALNGHRRRGTGEHVQQQGGCEEEGGVAHEST